MILVLTARVRCSRDMSGKDPTTTTRMQPGTILTLITIIETGKDAYEVITLFTRASASAERVGRGFPQVKMRLVQPKVRTYVRLALELATNDTKGTLQAMSLVEFPNTAKDQSPARLASLQTVISELATNQCQLLDPSISRHPSNLRLQDSLHVRQPVKSDFHNNRHILEN